LDAYVISLARSVDRRKAFLKLNKQAYPGIVVFDAIDGKAISRAEAVAQGVIDPNATGYTPGAVGSAMSHRALWQKCVELGRPILVFEDDAIPRRDFSEQFDRVMAGLKDGWEIVRLGFNLDSVIDVRLSGFFNMNGGFSVSSPSAEQLTEFAAYKEPAVAFRLNNAFGLCAYAIAPSGARFLLKKCFPLTDKRIYVPALKRDTVARGTDYMMNAVYREMRAYLTLPPLVLTANSHADSTVQKTSGPPRSAAA
jgi:GR25 family glycosyltransferase involved in LPS biosynthesis